MGCRGGSMEDCRIEGYRLASLTASTAEVRFRRCEFRIAGDVAWGVLTRGKLTVEDSTMVGVGGETLHGLKAMLGGDVAIRRCRMTALTGEAVQADGSEGPCSVTVVDTVIDGCRHGLAMTGEAELATQDCSVTARRAGAYIPIGGGTFTAKRVRIAADTVCVEVCCGDAAPTEVKLVDVQVSSGHGGLLFSGTRVEASLLRCHVSDVCTGVVICGGARCRIKASHVARCRNGVVVGDRVKDLEVECEECGRRGAGAAAAAFQALVHSGGVAVTQARCGHEGAMAEAVLSRVDVSTCLRDGVAVMVGGFLDATEVTVRNCGIGFTMEYLGLRSGFTDCAAIACSTGAQALRRRHADTGDEAAPVVIAEIEVVPGVSM